MLASLGGYGDGEEEEEEVVVPVKKAKREEKDDFGRDRGYQRQQTSAKS